MHTVVGRVEIQHQLLGLDLKRIDEHLNQLHKRRDNSNESDQVEETQVDRCRLGWSRLGGSRGWALDRLVFRFTMESENMTRLVP